MGKNYLAIGITLCMIAFSFLFFNNTSHIFFVPNINAVNHNLSLITEPDNGILPVLTLIRNASTSVDLVMYELEDTQIENALIADSKRGVGVRVLLSSGYKGESFAANQHAYNFLRENDVPVEWTQDYFALTHEKSLVVDGSSALIMTFNLTSQYYATSRDFGILDNEASDVSAIEQTFNNDWQGNNLKAGNGDDLVWSPGSEPTLIALINNAQKSLDIYNEEMADSRITKALIDAAERGVIVNIDMTYSSEWKKVFEELVTAGAHVRTYDEDAPLYIHAKMIIADSSQAFIGSENFSENSLDDNRELGIIMTDPNSIASLTTTFNSDWKGATVFSL